MSQYLAQLMALMATSLMLASPAAFSYSRPLQLPQLFRFVSLHLTADEVIIDDALSAI